MEKRSAQFKHNAHPHRTAPPAIVHAEPSPKPRPGSLSGETVNAPQPNAKEAAALAASALGLRVHPLRGKDPSRTGWQTLATIDSGVIRRFWYESPHANIGCAPGAGSGVFVLDVDPKNGGMESLAALEAKHGTLPETWQVVTGSGGLHIYFNHPGFRVRNIILAPGIDVRGDGGNLVLPGSIHPTTGRTYEWEAAHHPDDIPRVDAPEWLTNHLAAALATPDATAVDLPDVLPDVDINLLGLAGKPALYLINGAPLGKRSEALAAVYHAMTEAGHDYVTIAAAVMASPLAEKVNEKGRGAMAWLAGDIARVLGPAPAPAQEPVQSSAGEIHCQDQLTAALAHVRELEKKLAMAQETIQVQQGVIQVQRRELAELREMRATEQEFFEDPNIEPGEKITLLRLGRTIDYERSKAGAEPDQFIRVHLGHTRDQVDEIGTIHEAYGLAQQTGLSAGTVSRKLDRFRDAGIIEKISPIDRTTGKTTLMVRSDHANTTDLLRAAMAMNVNRDRARGKGPRVCPDCGDAGTIVTTTICCANCNRTLETHQHATKPGGTETVASCNGESENASDAIPHVDTYLGPSTCNGEADALAAPLCASGMTAAEAIQHKKDVHSDYADMKRDAAGVWTCLEPVMVTPPPVNFGQGLRV